MTHPTDFIVVVSDFDDYMTGYHVFAEKVNRKLRVGYQLHGQPVVVERMMCQAMTKVLVPGAESPMPGGDTTQFHRRAAQA
jgi:hypothetical protein